MTDFENKPMHYNPYVGQGPNINMEKTNNMDHENLNDNSALDISDINTKVSEIERILDMIEKANTQLSSLNSNNIVSQISDLGKSFEKNQKNWGSKSVEIINQQRISMIYNRFQNVKNSYIGNLGSHIIQKNNSLSQDDNSGNILVNELKQKIKDVENENKNLKNQLNDYINKNNKDDQNMKNLILKSEEDFRKAYSRLKLKYKNLENQNKQFVDEIDNLKQSNSSLNKKIKSDKEKMLSEVKIEKQKNENLNILNKEFKKNFMIKDMEINNLNKQLEELKENNNILKERIDSLNESYKKERIENSEDIDGYKNKLKKIEKKFKNQNDLIEQYEQELSSKHEIILRLQKNSNNASINTDSLNYENELKKKNDEIAKLKKELELKKEEFKKKINEITLLLT